MNEPLITECPGCHSRFRVTEGQLNLAQGQVRCGACLLVFDARAEAHRLERKQHQEPKSRAKRSRVTRPDTDLHTPDQPPVPHQRNRKTTERPIEKPRDKADRVDPKPASDTPEPLDTRNPGGQKPHEDKSREDQANPLPKIDREEPLAAVTRSPLSTTLDNGPEQEPPGFDPLDNIPHLYAEPILLEISRERYDPYATTGWALASLVALLVLAGQYLWFERATLALNPDLHPIYTLACDRLPCQLGKGAYRSIVNRNMVVRPHPAFADALSIDIQLRNDAAFAQPYPALELTFTDLKGRLVAGRVFQPREYLPADRAGSPMQAMAPVQLQLEITDPGVRAVSYQLTLRPAERG